MAAAGIITYGAYRTGALDSVISSVGKTRIRSNDTEWSKKLSDLFKENLNSMSNTRSEAYDAKKQADDAMEKLKNLSKNASQIKDVSKTINKS